jgi:hypothetical protein
VGVGVAIGPNPAVILATSARSAGPR